MVYDRNGERSMNSQSPEVSYARPGLYERTCICMCSLPVPYWVIKPAVSAKQIISSKEQAAGKLTTHFVHDLVPSIARLDDIKELG